MGRIRVLDAALVNRIAAGEVVERPASVVKELVENALDAGARRVEVEIEEGGRRRIRVADDGTGIEPEDLALVFRSHATSKLAREEDLVRVATFGFRGEALASIGAVAQVRIVTRVRGAECGYEVECRGGPAGQVRPVAAREGTVVEVAHLFYNVPARRKFLRGPQVEAEHVREVLARFGVAHPQVAWSLVQEGQPEWVVAEGMTVRERIAHFHGAELAEALWEVEGAGEGFRFRALAAPPRCARLTMRGLQFFVQGRHVRDRVLARAVGEAYREFVAHGRVPVAFVFLEVDPAEVDVNVHPTKIEVRFRRLWAIHDALAAALRERLVRSDVAPPLPAERFVEPEATSAPVPVREIVEAFRVRPPAVEAPPMVAGGHRFFQVHRRYLIEEAEDGIRIIDQHALHERILLEELRQEFGRGRIAAQRLLVPAVVPVSPARRALLEEYRSLLESVGVEFEEFGPDQVAVRTVPALLAGEDPRRMLEDFLDRAQEAEGSQTRGENLRFATIEETLEFLACRAAVRFGDALAPQQIERLLAKRAQVEHAHSCAHGRPVAVKMTLAELERIFQRK